MELLEYRTVATTASLELKIEKSVFIGHVSGADTVQDAQSFINQIRSEHAQATHNCYAYVIGWGKNQQVHFHDHGEPSGTAGKPILGSINRLELTNTVVVVTRYFGGRKLGVRGLIDAYHSVALQVLAKAGKARIVPSFTLILTCDYAQLSPVNQVLHACRATTQETTYGEHVSLRLRAPEENREKLFKALSSLTGVAWTETEKK